MYHYFHLSHAVLLDPLIVFSPQKTYLTRYSEIWILDCHSTTTFFDIVLH